MDAGDPEFGAYSLQVIDRKDRELPFPSPSANLAGIWKGKGRNKDRRPGGFFISS